MSLSFHTPFSIAKSQTIAPEWTKTWIVLWVSLISGCASFPEYKTAKIDSIPVSKTTSTEKPSAYLPLKFLSNLNGDQAPNLESTTPLPMLRQIVEKAANDSALFNSFTFESFQAKNVDYVLQIEVKNYGSLGKAAGAGFITGLSLFVIPSAATDNYSLVAKLHDGDGKLLKTYSYEDAITTWFGIWLIPMAGNTPNDAFQSVMDNMLKTLFRDLVKDNVLIKPKTSTVDKPLSFKLPTTQIKIL